MSTSPTSSANRLRFRAWIPEHKIGGETYEAHMDYNVKAGSSVTKTREYIHQATETIEMIATVRVNDIFKEDAGDCIWMQSTGLLDRNRKEIF